LIHLLQNQKPKERLRRNRRESGKVHLGGVGTDMMVSDKNLSKFLRRQGDA
jgi:hypothetical protein